MEVLDNIFQKSETQKNIALSDGAWNRLDDMLESDDKKPKWIKFRLIGIAASFILLAGLLYTFQSLNRHDYKLELLDIAEVDLIYSAEDIALLNSEYQNLSIQKLKPNYNKNAEVKAIVQ